VFGLRAGYPQCRDHCAAQNRAVFRFIKLAPKMVKLLLHHVINRLEGHQSVLPFLESKMTGTLPL
jgi:hypothetical protein